MNLIPGLPDELSVMIFHLVPSGPPEIPSKIYGVVPPSTFQSYQLVSRGWNSEFKDLAPSELRAMVVSGLDAASLHHTVHNFHVNSYMSCLKSISNQCTDFIFGTSPNNVGDRRAVNEACLDVSRFALKMQLGQITPSPGYHLHLDDRIGDPLVQWSQGEEEDSMKTRLASTLWQLTQCGPRVHVDIAGISLPSGLGRDESACPTELTMNASSPCWLRWSNTPRYPEPLKHTYSFDLSRYELTSDAVSRSTASRARPFLDRSERAFKRQFAAMQACTDQSTPSSVTVNMFVLPGSANSGLFQQVAPLLHARAEKARQHFLANRPPHVNSDHSLTLNTAVGDLAYRDVRYTVVPGY